MAGRILLCIVCLAGAVFAQSDGLRRRASLKTRVDTAVADAAAFLKSKYDPKRGWGGARGTGVYGNVGTAYPYEAGPTALCVYALLKAGVPADDPVLRKAMTFLRVHHRKPGVAYEISVLIVAVAERAGAARSPDFRRPELRSKRSNHRFEVPAGSPFPKREWTWMVDLVEKLLRFQSKAGGWRYYPRDFHSGGRADVSSTQFALLALSTASRCGLAVPSDAFKRARGFLLEAQARTGPEVARAIHLPGSPPDARDRARGFPYIAGSKVMQYRRISGGMSAAGLASLLFVREERSHLPRDEDLEQAILDGFAWLGRYFTVQVNPGYYPFSLGSYHYLYLYAIERCGDLARRELIGGRTWFREGATLLISRQRKDGAIPDPTCMYPQDVLGTATALLFLTRATRPVSGG